MTISKEEIEELAHELQHRHSTVNSMSMRDIAKWYLTELSASTAKIKELERVYQQMKDWGHRLENRLITLLEQFDQHSDGAPDASELGKFCNEMSGLSNEIMLSDVRGIRSERDALKRQLGECVIAIEESNKALKCPANKCKEVAQVIANNDKALASTKPIDDGGDK